MMLTHGANSLPRGGGGMTVNIGGREYPVVKIGNLYWTAENLNWKYPTLPIGAYNEGDVLPETPNAWYYNNDEATYGEIGLFYNVFAQQEMNSMLPSGWRIPTVTDLTSLTSYTQAELTAVSSGGTDETHLSLTTPNRVGTTSYGADGYKCVLNFPPLSRPLSSLASLEQNGTTIGYKTYRILQLAEGDAYLATQYGAYGFKVRLVKDA